MRIIKSEWHQVEKRYAIDIDENIINEIYEDATVEEIEEIMRQLKEGELNASTIIEDASSNDVDFDWDWLDEDDWWTDRKGGYEVTYKAENWEVHHDYVAPITHKCTKCKWSGASYDSAWSWEDKDGMKRYITEVVCSELLMLGK